MVMRSAEFGMKTREAEKLRSEEVEKFRTKNYELGTTNYELVLWFPLC
jgi:hypothetical protein